MNKENEKNLYRALLSLENEADCEAFLSDILTAKELLDLSARLSVAEMLSRGVNYIDIAEATGASTATISRVSKCLSGSVGGYRTVLERLKRGSETIAVPSFKIAIADAEWAEEAYRMLAAEYPFLPRDISPRKQYNEKTVRCSIVSPSDVPTLVEAGVYDLGISSEWDVYESGAELSFKMQIGVKRSFSLVKTGGESGVVASPYPRLAMRELSGLGKRIVRLDKPSEKNELSHFYGAYTMSAEGEGEKSMSALLVGCGSESEKLFLKK